MTDSLHVRHRPKKFDQVIGNSQVVKGVKRAAKDKRAHAFIFTGPAGTGKTTLARILANSLCGGKANAANIEEIPAAVATGVDAMRQVADRSNYRAIGNSTTKVIILDEAHRLSQQAWDSLLKVVEEPSSHVYWMFCTTNVSKIPKTIQTRCLRYDLNPVSEEDILGLLKEVSEKEEIELDDEILETIAENAEGSPRQALVYLESCIYCESASEARKVMQKAGETKEIVDLARFLISKGNKDWKTAQKILNDLKDNSEAESVRIVICNYFANALLSTKNDKEAARMMSILDCFSQPYNSPEKYAPLLLSIGEALGMGE